MMTHPLIMAALVRQHRDDLLRQARAGRDRLEAVPRANVRRLSSRRAHHDAATTVSRRPVACTDPTQVAATT
jgi:hypothetical protein